MGSNYNSPPPESLSNFKSVPRYESGNWVAKDAKFDAKTTNNRELPVRKMEGPTRA